MRKKLKHITIHRTKTTTRMDKRMEEKQQYFIKVENDIKIILSRDKSTVIAYDI
jgi:hypothetical protein